MCGFFGRRRGRRIVFHAFCTGLGLYSGPRLPVPTTQTPSHSHITFIAPEGSEFASSKSCFLSLTVNIMNLF